jgi:hypothetical protein
MPEKPVNPLPAEPIVEPAGVGTWSAGTRAGDTVPDTCLLNEASTEGPCLVSNDVSSPFPAEE